MQVTWRHGKIGGMKPRCDGCAFWEFDEFSSGNKRPLGSDTAIGNCLRYPPLPRDEGLAVFPTTREDDWCGEFKAKESQAVEREGASPIPIKLLGVKGRRVIEHFAITTMEELAAISEDDIIAVPSCGINAAVQVRDAVETWRAFGDVSGYTKSKQMHFKRRAKAAASRRD